MSEASEPAPGDLKRRVIVRTLPCRGCSYDLRGLRIDRRCPECGLDVLGSVLEAVDPASEKLPLIRNPWRVGDGLLWLMACLLAATVLIVLRPVASALDEATSLGVASSLARWTSMQHVPLAGLLVLLALPAVWQLAPPRGREPRAAVWRDLSLLAAGLLVWGLLLIGTWWWERWGVALSAPDATTLRDVVSALLRVAAVGAILTVLLATRRILRVIGERSREYRDASGGRQRIRDMMAAAVGLVVGEGLILAGRLAGNEALTTVGIVVISICAFMLVIGLIYLVVNAWWIRRSLRRPPPQLWRVLGVEGEEPQTSDPPATRA